MATSLIRRESIDIKPDTFQILSVKAAERGISLKSYIERSLDIVAEDEEDFLLYNKYIKNNPECWEFLSAEESAAFEVEIGL
jgi:hypothetical protein